MTLTEREQAVLMIIGLAIASEKANWNNKQIALRMTYLHNEHFPNLSFETMEELYDDVSKLFKSFVIKLEMLKDR